jgi:hypothetical protein
MAVTSVAWWLRRLFSGMAAADDNDGHRFSSTAPLLRFHEFSHIRQIFRCTRTSVANISTVSAPAQIAFRNENAGAFGATLLRLMQQRPLSAFRAIFRTTGSRAKYAARALPCHSLAEVRQSVIPFQQTPKSNPIP